MSWLDFSKTPPSVWRDPVHWLAFGFGTGAFPKAPGTVGTLAAIPIYLLISDLEPVWYLLLLIGFTLIGIYLCGKTSDDIGVKDHSGIVWDEITGYLLTMFMAPQGWLWIVLGFVYFRVFDIFKPWPISWLDRRVEGGLGIMLDDLLAGIFALLALRLTAMCL